MKHFLGVWDISSNDIKRLFSIALDLECYLNMSHSDSVQATLSPRWEKLMGTLFLEPSTRTRISFEVAMKRMGGDVVSVADGKSCSKEKGESLEDTIRTMSQYVDLLIVRANEAHGCWGQKNFACPVINGGDGGNEHPTQALVDAFTIWKCFNTLSDLNVAFVGDLFNGRTVHSLARLLVRERRNNFYLLGEPELPHTYFFDTTSKKSVTKEEFLDILPNIDVLYMTRMQSERGTKGGPPFVLGKNIVDRMHRDAIVMHPLPRLQELPRCIDDNHRAVYFDQVKNGVPVRMALIRWLFEKW